MPKPFLLLILHLAFLFFAFTANGQSVAYHLSTDADGLASNTIYSIVQHTDGYLWLGTSNGLVRYDGQHFEILKIKALKDNEILKIVEDEYGTVWGINLTGELFSVRSDFKTINLSADKELPKLATFTYFQNRIIGVLKTRVSPKDLALGILQTNKMGKVKTFERQFLSGIISQRLNNIGDNIWLKNQLYQFDNQKKLVLAPIDSANTFYYLYSSVLDKVFIDKHRLRWTRSGRDLLPPDVLLNLKDYAVNSLFLDDDFLMIGTRYGLQVFNAQNPNDQRIYFPSFIINAINKDREGNYILGTANNGIIHIKDFSIKHFTRENSALNSDLIYKLYHQPNGALYIFQSDGYVTTISKNGQSQTDKTQIQGDITDIIELYPNQLLISADELLLFDIRTKSTRRILTSNSIKKMLLWNDQLWLCNHMGIYRLDKVSATQEMVLQQADRVFDSRTYDLLRDENDRLWIASTKGLFVMENEKVNPYPIEESLTALSMDSKGRLLVGTSNKGVFVLQDNQIIDTIDVDAGLESNTIQQLKQWKNATWIQTNRSLTKWDDSGLLHYNFNTGIPTREINDIAFFQEKIWIATRLGLVNFPVKYDPTNNVKPLLYLKSLTYRNEPVDSANYNQLPHQQNDLAIHFAGINFSNRADMSYSYQLKGHDPFSLLTDKTQVNYTALSAGSYQFSITAINESGVKSETKQIEFKIIPPIYQRWWFYPLLILIVLGSSFWWWSSRVKKREKERALTHQLTKLQQQALQTQMNPHFIFNSMNTIQHYITSNEKTAAITYLSRFARLIRLIFEYSKRDVINIDDEIQFLQLYIQLEQLRFGDKITVDFQIESSITERGEDIEIPPLLLQPLIENAFKHGLFHKEKPGNLRIHLQHKNQSLICTITDDGVGRIRAQELNQWRSKNHQSAGISTIQQRLRLLYVEDKTPPETFRVQDLVDGQGNAMGTEVTVKIKTA